jgi:hypothetical protein
MPVPMPTVQPLDQFTDAALVTDTVAGARVILYQNGVWLAWTDATATATRIPIPHRLAPADTITAAQELSGERSPLSAPVLVELNHVTHHFDNARSGWNPYETVLSRASVPTLAQLFTPLRVDGQVYAQPLYVQQLNIPRHGMHNVLYVATENDTIYAFDADDGAALWPQPRSLVPAGESVVSMSDVGNCVNISPVVGITATPVIDRPTNTMYVVAMTKAGTVFHQRLHALDITTGADQPGSPVEIQGAVQGNADGQVPAGSGTIPFDPKQHNSRAALLLQDGVIYACFASHCDNTPYHGWIMAYDAATLAPVAVFNTTPETGEPGSVGPGSGGGVWQSGYGPAADSAGYLYLLTGNGPFNHTGAAPGRDYGNSVLKLRPDLSVADFFTPWDQQQLATNDTDIGSGGAMVLPDRPGPTGELLVGCGKEGTIYLMDRQDLGGYAGPPPGTTASSGTDKVVQSMPNAVGGIWGGPAFYQGPTGPFIYYCGNNDHLKAFHLVGSSLIYAGQTADTFNGTGGHEGGSIPTVSSNGSASDGSGIVWAITRDAPPGQLKLRAYDAANLASKLFEGDIGPWTNDSGGPFMVPTVINGKVYAGADGVVAVFGVPPLKRMSVQVENASSTVRQLAVQVTVTDLASGAPIPNATVKVFRSGQVSATGTTGPQGSVVLTYPGCSEVIIIPEPKPHSITIPVPCAGMVTKSGYDDATFSTPRPL